MKRLNNRGIALVEILLGLALIAIILPTIYQLYMFGQETFDYNGRYIAQQYVVTDTLAHIRGDVQEAASVKTESSTTGVYPITKTLKLGYIDGTSTTVNKHRYWRFYCLSAGSEGILQCTDKLDISETISDDDFEDVVKGLDFEFCGFFRSTNPADVRAYNKLVVAVKPIETNQGRGEARNIREPYITEMSVQYKD